MRGAPCQRPEPFDFTLLREFDTFLQRMEGGRPENIVGNIMLAGGAESLTYNTASPFGGSASSVSSSSRSRFDHSANVLPYMNRVSAS